MSIDFIILQKSKLLVRIRNSYLLIVETPINNERITVYNNSNNPINKWD